MKVSELAKSVSDLRTKMEGRFAAVDGEFKTLRELIKSEGETLRRDIEETLSQRIKSEGETTRRHFDSEGETIRRHFDVVAEKMVSERNLALDRSMATAQQLVQLTASNAGDHVRFERRLDDHDGRLEKIEGGHDTDPSVIRVPLEPIGARTAPRPRALQCGRAWARAHAEP